MTTDPEHQTARAIARAELTNRIKESASRQLGDVGSTALSVRAVARDLKLASSAVYRYFPGRDELLTALIVDAYTELAHLAEASAAQSAGQDFHKRWIALTRIIRTWAVENRHEYELIYGTPVPGYRAPADTIDPAQRLTLAAIKLVADAVESGEINDSGASNRKRGVHSSLSTIREAGGFSLSDELLLSVVAAWTQLFGHISFELFGQFQNVVEDYDSFFSVQMDAAALRLSQ